MLPPLAVVPRVDDLLRRGECDARVERRPARHRRVDEEARLESGSANPNDSATRGGSRWSGAAAAPQWTTAVRQRAKPPASSGSARTL